MFVIFDSVWRDSMMFIFVFVWGVGREWVEGLYEIDWKLKVVFLGGRGGIVIFFV